MDQERIILMKRLSSIVFAALIVSGACSAQVVMPDRGASAELKRNVFGLGFAGGPASGIGLSFRHHLPSIMSYQINGGIIKVDDRMSYTIGAEVQGDLARTQVARFFAVGGISYFYTGRTNHNDMDGPGRVGVGLGGEVYGGSGIHTTVELLFTYFSDGTVLPLPQIGFHYYFQ
jgi:hypothetical protein